MGQGLRANSGKRRRVILFLSSMLLGGPALGQAPAGEDPPRAPAKDFSDKPAYEVLDVRAGNVLVVRLAGENRVLRLIGVYVPSSGSAEDAARPYMMRLLQGEAVHVEYEADWPLRDREDRYWAYVYRAPDGLFVNLELIRLGYARLSALEPFEHQKLFRTYEQHARKLKKGTWSPDAAVHSDEQPATQPAATTRPVPGERDAAKDGATKKDAADESTIVSVMVNGRKYHRQDCVFVRAGAITMSLKDAKARGFTPCAKCRPPE